MQGEMARLAGEGVAGGDRMRQAAVAWRALHDFAKNGMPSGRYRCQNLLFQRSVRRPNVMCPQLGPFFVPACPPLTAINGD